MFSPDGVATDLRRDDTIMPASTTLHLFPNLPLFTPLLKGSDNGQWHADQDRTLLWHRSNFGQMPFLCHQWWIPAGVEPRLAGCINH